MFLVPKDLDISKYYASESPHSNNATASLADNNHQTEIERKVSGDAIQQEMDEIEHKVSGDANQQEERDDDERNYDTVQPCRGFRGIKINELFKQSFVEGPLRTYDMTECLPGAFDLPLCLQINNSGADGLQFTLNHDLTWRFGSKYCEGTYVTSGRNSARCPSCSRVASVVKNIGRRLNAIDKQDMLAIADISRLSDRRYLEFSFRPEKFRAVLDEIRRRKDNQIETLREDVRVCCSRLQQAMDSYKESVCVDDIGDQERCRSALEMLKPVISKRYGCDSDYAMVWEQMIQGIGRPIDGKPRYNSPALLFGIELAAQTKADVYEKVASLLNLPPRNHCKRVQRKMIYGKQGSYKTGFQHHTVSMFRKVAKEKGLFTSGPIAVCLAFDSMIMKKNIILSSRSEDKGRLIGCVVSDDLNTLENHFENYVQKVTHQARISGETRIFDESMNDPFQHNREHLVCYARSMAPGVDLAFIAGAWNLPSCRKIDLVGIVHDVMLGLFNLGFEARVITCDNAQCNEGFLKTMACLKPKDILPSSLLAQYQLPGDVFVAMKHPITRKPVIYISDPPHCLKRLAGAVRTRDLQYDGYPLTGRLLFDVWQAIQASYGGDASLNAYRKYKHTDFIDGGSFASMEVASAARLFSSTTGTMLDEVAARPETYPTLTKIPKSVDRTKFLARIREMVVLLNSFFDLCNGKDGSNLFVRFNKGNGEKYQRKFLETLKWFREWEVSLGLHKRAKNNEVARSHFIATETYRSLKYACYGFACLIEYQCILNDKKESISPCKINQDICEHHFANVRRSCATHANPTEVECMASIMKSAFFRMEKVKKSNCGSITTQQQRSIVPLSLALKSSKRENGTSMTRKRTFCLSRQRSQFGKTSKMRRIIA